MRAKTGPGLGLPPEDLLLRALATEIVENTSAVAVTPICHMMGRMLSEDHPMAAHRIDSRGIDAVGQSADAKEGVSSLLKKARAEISEQGRSRFAGFLAVAGRAEVLMWHAARGAACPTEFGPVEYRSPQEE